MVIQLFMMISLVEKVIVFELVVDDGMVAMVPHHQYFNYHLNHRDQLCSDAGSLKAHMKGCSWVCIRL